MPAEPLVPRWTVFELRFRSAVGRADPLRDVRLTATFAAPDGGLRQVEGFWDGDNVWCIRFAPDEPGVWSYATNCEPADDAALHGRSGSFRCVAPRGGTRFERHGFLRLSADRRHLVHADGTPFFWLADTAWNGPLRATAREWDWYLGERGRQRFNAVQWVATQWLGSPEGDRDGAKAFTGTERIAIDPAFFRRLDARAGAVARAGLLNVPVLLWTATWSTPDENAKNPGVFLPEDQAILLARYLVARWSALPVVWMLGGDGDYRGGRAERWRRIGRAVFGEAPHAPVVLHPAAMEWTADGFRDEPWLDLLGYQSGHGDEQDSLTWLVSGPPATDWRNAPARPIINLEPPYEDHLGLQSHTRLDAGFVRRAMYWSLLVSPTAGVSYGGHGVWGWDDGRELTPGHVMAGRPRPWREALALPGAQQIGHLAELFTSIAWWRLVPAPELLARQPGTEDRRRFVAAAATPDGTLTVIYLPVAEELVLTRRALGHDVVARWFDPRDGAWTAAPESGLAPLHFTPPAPGDWVLVLQRD